jgi:hypothetical protein
VSSFDSSSSTGMFVDRLGEEFGDVAVRIVDDLALLDSLAAVEHVGLH